jgi:hypothetical protein
MMTRLAEKTDDRLVYEVFGPQKHGPPRTLLFYMRGPKEQPCLLVEADGLFVLGLRKMKQLHAWLGGRIEEAEKK